MLWEIEIYTLLRVLLCERALQDLANGYGDTVAFDEDLPLGDGLIVREHDDGVVLVRIEFDNRAAAHPEQLVDRDHGVAKNHSDFDFDGIQRRHGDPTR